MADRLVRPKRLVNFYNVQKRPGLRTQLTSPSHNYERNPANRYTTALVINIALTENKECEDEISIGTIFDPVGPS